MPTTFCFPNRSGIGHFSLLLGFMYFENNVLEEGPF